MNKALHICMCWTWMDMILCFSPFLLDVTFFGLGAFYICKHIIVIPR